MLIPLTWSTVYIYSLHSHTNICHYTDRVWAISHLIFFACENNGQLRNRAEESSRRPPGHTLHSTITTPSHVDGEPNTLSTTAQSASGRHQQWSLVGWSLRLLLRLWTLWVDWLLWPVFILMDGSCISSFTIYEFIVCVLTTYTVCISFWCPCVTFGQVAEILDRGSSCKTLFKTIQYNLQYILWVFIIIKYTCDYCSMRHKWLLIPPHSMVDWRLRMRLFMLLSIKDERSLPIGRRLRERLHRPFLLWGLCAYSDVPGAPKPRIWSLHW